MNKSAVNNQLAVSTWEEIGAWWDEQMLEGDTFHTHLVHPYVLSLLDAKPEDQIVDLACGNGGLTRRISQQIGKSIWGVDCSSTLLAGAQKREQELALKNHYQLLDLVDEASLVKLRSLEKFNKAVCSMAIQDIEQIEPLLASVKQLLPRGGYFVVSIPHPCFNSGEMSFQLKEKDVNVGQGILRTTYSKPVKLLVHAKENQPKPHPHFHRSFSLLLNLFFKAGFVLDRCEEPVFQEKEIKALASSFLWAKFPEIPPVMVLRFIA